MKVRILVAIGGMLVVLGLVGCSVLGGASSPTITPIPPGDGDAIIESGATPESVPVTPEVVDASGDQGPASCVAGKGEAVYSKPDQGYCLAYPADFIISEQDTGATVISGTVPGPSIAGFVNITTQPAQGRTAPQVSDELVADFLGTDILPERTDNILGGEPAVEIIGMPGQDLSWYVIAAHNDTVYTLIFAPMGDENGQAFTDMQLLYEVAMRTFQFTQ